MRLLVLLCLAAPVLAQGHHREENRALLGIIAAPAPSGKKQPPILVAHVLKKSPADKAGLEVGDELVSVADTTITRSNDVVFMHVQTVWEGTHTNTPERGPKEVRKAGSKAPTGFDGHVDGARTSVIMHSFGTGGTPWTIIIDRRGEVQVNEVTPADVEALAKKIDRYRKKR